MEELDFKPILEQLGQFDLSPIERVLAAHTGTVQLLLSLWWNEAVMVELTSPQSRTDNVLTREVALKLDKSGKEVASAISTIEMDRNNESVIADIEAGELGIGQIALKHEINIRRRILKIGIMKNNLYRKYRMEGSGLHFDIEEFFPRRLYRQWPDEAVPVVDDW